MIAYDFETERIAVGTPRPLWLTAFNPTLMHFESEIRDMTHLRAILVQHFLIDDFHGVKFVAWNGNRFDALYIAAALVVDSRFMLRPYLTQNNTLRGLRVSLAEDGDTRTGRSWEFLDGIAMLGLAGVSLDKLLKNFAPDHHKLTDIIDFEKESFDPDNPEHRAYAMRDSVGLWHAMERAQSIMLRTFNEPLAVTMGGVCVKIFQAHIPRGVVVDALIPDVEQIVFQFVMRGGFCYLSRRYDGPIWKYDINQAYAAAMREAELPCSGMLHGNGNPIDGKTFIVRLSARKPGNKIPFYYRTEEGGRVRSKFGIETIDDTWLTSIEYRQLRAEGWQIRCAEFWQWGRSFSMREYVDKLETLRTTCDGGPSGPIGTMIKATGNHSYGKTVERVSPIELTIASECPDGWHPYFGDSYAPIDHIFYRFDLDRRPKAYHQPHIGAFITAHVRMVLRRAALIDPDAWIYADTDCVVFSRDVTSELDIDSKRYGAWKIEESGTEFQMIAKKVYHEKRGTKRSAKGLNVKRLSSADFELWFEGSPPEQDQIQLQGFLQIMQGANMYRAQKRKGTRVEATI